MKSWSRPHRPSVHSSPSPDQCPLSIAFSVSFQEKRTLPNRASSPLQNLPSTPNLSSLEASRPCSSTIQTHPDIRSTGEHPPPRPPRSSQRNSNRRSERIAKIAEPATRPLTAVDHCHFGTDVQP